MHQIKDPNRRARAIDSMFVHTEGAIMRWMKQARPSLVFPRCDDEYPAVQSVKGELRSKKNKILLTKLKIVDRKHISALVNPKSGISEDAGIKEIVKFYVYAVDEVYGAIVGGIENKTDQTYFKTVKLTWQSTLGTWKPEFISLTERKFNALKYGLEVLNKSGDEARIQKEAKSYIDAIHIRNNFMDGDEHKCIVEDGQQTLESQALPYLGLTSTYVPKEQFVNQRSWLDNVGGSSIYD